MPALPDNVALCFSRAPVQSLTCALAHQKLPPPLLGWVAWSRIAPRVPGDIALEQEHLNDVSGGEGLHHDISTVTGEMVVLFTLAESPDYSQPKKR